MTATGRLQRTERADALCVGAFGAAGLPEEGVALVAVGGYGRRELAPYSDLDVVLVTADGVDPGQGAQDLWYPLWDAGTRLDHSVRTEAEMAKAAADDLKVALGLLDLRPLAGDVALARRVRSEVLAHWRRTAKERLPALRELGRARHELLGELAHLSVPDLKESEGGLRDATVLKALVATWLVDVPHRELEAAREALLDVRDVLHDAAGRATDRVAPELWDGLAEGLGLESGDEAQRHVRRLGRRLAHLSRLTWRQADGVLAKPRTTGPRRPELVPLGTGLALSKGEVVLTSAASPADDPVLLLRAAALAAERDALLAPATVARLASESPGLLEPWADEARQLLVRLLAAGRGLLPVWETLEEVGAIDQVLPEWERIRLLPHASEIHRFTVDRHVVETCIEASALIRDVARPDVLLVAALLHDIGKGGLTEHSVAGEPIARAVATRLGFEPDAVELVATLVRWHLLLGDVATRRDPEDPATVSYVLERVGDPEALALLLRLTEADARATHPKAWSAWRSGLITALVQRALAAAGSTPARPQSHPEVAVPKSVRRGGVDIGVEPGPDGARVTVLAPDRVGLLADAAALFALSRTSVRAARAWAQDDVGVSVWDVAGEAGEPAVLRQRFEAIVAGRVDPSARLRPSADGLAPTVVVRPEASARATVIEVRTADRPGVVHLVCKALASLDLTVRSAHVDTLGPQAVDVFYVQESSAGGLSDERAAAAAHAVRDALTA